MTTAHQLFTTRAKARGATAEMVVRREITMK
jgi:hypothetical protein